MLLDMPTEHKDVIENYFKSPPPSTRLPENELADFKGLEHNITIATTTIGLDNSDEIPTSKLTTISEDSSDTMDSLIAIEEDPNDPEWHSRPARS